MSKKKSIFITIGYFVLAIIVQLLTAIIGGIVLTAIFINKYGANKIDDSEALLSYMGNKMNWILLASSLITILIVILIKKIRKKDYKEELFLKGTPIKYLGISFLIGISTYAISTIFIAAMEWIGLFPESFKKLLELTDSITEGNKIIMILSIGIVGPIAEELIFRSAIFNTLKKSFSIKTVIIMQAVLFGIMHFNLVQGIYTSFVGVVLGYLTYKTKSVYPAIIVHITNNSVSLLLSWILGDTNISLINILPFLIAIPLLIYSIKYINKAEDNKSELKLDMDGELKR